MDKRNRPLLLGNSRNFISPHLWQEPFFLNYTSAGRELFVYILVQNEGGVINLEGCLHATHWNKEETPEEIYEVLNRDRNVLRPLGDGYYLVEDYFVFAKSNKKLNLDSRTGKDSKIVDACLHFGINPLTLRGCREVWMNDNIQDETGKWNRDARQLSEKEIEDYFQIKGFEKPSAIYNKDNNIDMKAYKDTKENLDIENKVNR